MRRLSVRPAEMSGLCGLVSTGTRSDSGGGHWSNYFTPKIRAAFKERYGGNMKKIDTTKMQAAE